MNNKQEPWEFKHSLPHHTQPNMRTHLFTYYSSAAAANTHTRIAMPEYNLLDKVVEVLVYGGIFHIWIKLGSLDPERRLNLEVGMISLHKN